MVILASRKVTKPRRNQLTPYDCAGRQARGRLEQPSGVALEENQWNVAATFFTKALEQDREVPRRDFSCAARFNAGDIAGAKGDLYPALESRPDQPEFVALREEIARAERASPR